MRISYNCYFIQTPYGIDIKLFISHTKRVNLCMAFIEFIDKPLILTRNKPGGRFFSKNSGQDFTGNKKNDQCDHNNKRSIPHLSFESLG